jgi:hypothetical protein
MLRASSLSAHIKLVRQVAKRVDIPIPTVSQHRLMLLLVPVGIVSGQAEAWKGHASGPSE